MFLVGSAGPTSETAVYRDYGSGRPFLVNGDMDEATFLRNFCGRREYGLWIAKIHVAVFVLLWSTL